MKNPLTDNLRCLSPLRGGRGELERTCLESLFGDPDTVPPKVPLSLRERERVRVRVRLDCMDTAKTGETPDTKRPSLQCRGGNARRRNEFFPPLRTLPTAPRASPLPTPSRPARDPRPCRL